MKKKVIFKSFAVLIVFITLSSSIKAQKFEIIPFAGYQTSARINAYQGYFRVNDGINYGAAVNFGANDGYKIELSYSRMASSLTYTYDNVTEMKCDLGLTYISIGGVVQINPENMVVPFGKIALGGAYYKSLNTDLEKESVMHFSFAGGAKIYLNDHIGVRLQATLHLPVYYVGQMFEDVTLPPDQTMKTKVGGVQTDLTVGAALRF